MTASSRGLASMVDSPIAPSRIASSRSLFIASISLAAGAGERIALHAFQQRAQPDVAGDVDGDALAFECVEVAAQRRPGARRTAALDRLRRPLSLGRAGRGILAQDLGRHSLADLALGAAVFEQRHVGMRMHVDEPGGDDQAACVDDRLAGASGRLDRTNGGDPVAADRHVAQKPGIAGPVDDLAAADQDSRTAAAGCAPAMAARARAPCAASSHLSACVSMIG